MLFGGQNEKTSHITERIKNTKVIIWKGRLKQELIQQQNHWASLPDFVILYKCERKTKIHS